MQSLKTVDPKTPSRQVILFCFGSFCKVLMSRNPSGFRLSFTLSCLLHQEDGLSLGRPLQSHSHPGRRLALRLRSPAAWRFQLHCTLKDPKAIPLQNSRGTEFPGAQKLQPLSSPAPFLVCFEGDTQEGCWRPSQVRGSTHPAPSFLAHPLNLPLYLWSKESDLKSRCMSLSGKEMPPNWGLGPHSILELIFC